MEGTIFAWVFFFAVLSARNIEAQSSINDTEFVEIKKIISESMNWNDVPDKLVGRLTILNKHLNILKKDCLPTKKDGECYHTAKKSCTLPNMKLGENAFRFNITICKKPLKIILRYKIRMPMWAITLYDVNFDPIEIIFGNDTGKGFSFLQYSSVAKTTLNGVTVGNVHATLRLHLFMRYDCTKPQNLLRRLSYNMIYDDGQPGADYNKHYYKILFRADIKLKSHNDFAFHCKSCENLAMGEGHLSEGPQYCLNEILIPLNYIENGEPWRGQTVYRHAVRKIRPRCYLIPFMGDKWHRTLREIQTFYNLTTPFFKVWRRQDRGDLIRYLRGYTVRCPRKRVLV